MVQSFLVGMQPNIEEDAVGTKFNFKSALLSIHDQLRSSDFESMKFLCADLISGGKMEKIKSALHLFEHLQNQNKISANNVLLLGELLYRIGRSDLLKNLQMSKETLCQSIVHKSTLDTYRVMLYKICEQLTSNETKELLFIFGENLARSKKETIEKPEEFFQALEKENSLRPHNLDLLIAMMRQIRRNDLIEMITKQMNIKEKAQLRRRRLEEDDVYQLPRHWQKELNDRTRTSDDTLPNNRTSTVVVVSNADDVLIGRTSTAADHLNRKPVSLRVEANVISCEDNNSKMMSRLDESFDLPCYSMTRKPRGICVIINNEHFYQVPSDPTSRKMPKRDGTSQDFKKLQDLFSRRLQFEVLTFENQTDEEMSLLLAMIALTKDHSNFDCFACCILSHGILGAIYGVNGKTVEIRDLTNFFKGASCPSLRGKPKLFFIQACQGKDKQTGYPIEMDTPASAAVEDGATAEPTIETIPNEADFLLGYATVPGYVSFRSKTQGSWYINTLVKMLDKYADRYDLLSILIKVNDEICQAAAKLHDGVYKQSPMPMATLRRRVYFR